jgi:hypothetical protein
LSRRHMTNSGEGEGGLRAGDFARLFADRDRTPVRIFLPERRVWQSLVAVLATLAVFTGIAVGISQLNFSASAGATRSRTPDLTAVPKQAKQQSQSPQGNIKQAANSPAAEPPPPANSQPSVSNAAPPPTASTTQRPTGGQTNSAPSANSSSTPSFSVQQSVRTGGNPYWAENVVAITTTTPLSALKIAVRVAQTGGVASTGTWSSLSGKVSINVAADSNGVNYLLTLNPGVTLPPGTYTFEAQYNHAQGSRNSQHDLYAITATPAGSSTSEGANGHF